jgi:hypothetical protein
MWRRVQHWLKSTSETLAIVPFMSRYCFMSPLPLVAYSSSLRMEAVRSSEMQVSSNTLGITEFLDFVHRMVFYKTIQHNNCETDPVSVTLCSVFRIPADGQSPRTRQFRRLEPCRMTVQTTWHHSQKITVLFTMFSRILYWTGNEPSRSDPAHQVCHTDPKLCRTNVAVRPLLHAVSQCCIGMLVNLLNNAAASSSSLPEFQPCEYNVQCCHSV